MGLAASSRRIGRIFEKCPNEAENSSNPASSTFIGFTKFYRRSDRLPQHPEPPGVVVEVRQGTVMDHLIAISLELGFRFSF